MAKLYNYDVMFDDTCIGDVGQNAFQAGVLKAAAVDGADTFRVQRTFRFQAGLTVEKVLKNAAHDGGFLRNNDQSAVLPTIPKNAEPPVWNTLFHALANAPFDVFTTRLALISQDCALCMWTSVCVGLLLFKHFPVSTASVLRTTRKPLCWISKTTTPISRLRSLRSTPKPY